LAFQDHFSQASKYYASARPLYPHGLFDWIAGVAPGTALAWEAGCGSGQASRDLATRFAYVHASDPSAAQIAQAPALDNVDFVIEPGERCTLADASVDVVCVAQALHWFDRASFFAECERVLRPGGVLVAWGYQDIAVPPEVRGSVDRFLEDIACDWPSQRADIDAAYAGYAWPFPRLEVPSFTMGAEWPLARLLAYFASFSATKRHRERTGRDPVAEHAEAIARAWGDPQRARPLSWPLFAHACRKPA